MDGLVPRPTHRTVHFVLVVIQQLLQIREQVLQKRGVILFKLLKKELFQTIMILKSNTQTSILNVTLMCACVCMCVRVHVCAWCVCMCVRGVCVRAHVCAHECVLKYLCMWIAMCVCVKCYVYMCIQGQRHFRGTHQMLGRHNSGDNILYHVSLHHLHKRGGNASIQSGAATPSRICVGSGNTTRVVLISFEFF